MSGAPADPAAARAALAAAPGEPVWLDLPVVATRVAARSGPSKLCLRLATDDGQELGTAWVFTREWYPGAPGSRFSHYFLTLARLFEGLERAERPPRSRLQLLRAVRAVAPSGRPMTVLLKFIIAPEYATTGGMLETIYGCPLASFYEHFVGIGRDVLRDRAEPTFTRGKAIHAGYRDAAVAFLRSADPDTARAAYLDGVRRSWTSDFPYLLLDRPKTGPKKLHTAPIAAAEGIVARCEEQWGDGVTATLLQERLLYAPSRGISGRADRIERRHGTIRLTEVKTGGSFGAERDPVTGARQAGGMQALAYQEALRARTDERTPTEALVEVLDEDAATALALAEHPVVTRARATLAPHDERALDLLAQSRNVGYLAATGLLTGYDRHRLDAVARAGRHLDAAGGDWDLYASLAPCQICPASGRAVCEQSRRPAAAPLYGLFRSAPPALFAYWAWFHRQLVDEDRAGREWLYHLATTPTPRLERQEGVTLTELRVLGCDGLTARLGRAAPLETRIREDDAVLVTPDGLAPGDGSSIEGTVQAMTGDELTIRLRDRLDDPHLRYRVDALGHLDPTNWQRQGLSDFLVTALDATPVRGRTLAVTELPPLAQAILGAAELPPLPDDPPVPPLVAPLNAAQRRAVAIALALDPTQGAPLLVQGPPGTGKTTVIAELARAILAREFCQDPPGANERPLLILANSHRAVDEVVRKLLDRFPDLAPYVVRVGAPRAGMDERVRSRVLTERLAVEARLQDGPLDVDGASRLVALIREGNLLHDQAAIFAGTLGAANRPELRGLTFRTVIVDETGQATEPAALQALRHMPPAYRARLVLVGDHQQLPPVVAEGVQPPPGAIPPDLQGTGLIEGDTLRTSLFERLTRRYPQRLLTLTDQYRMAAAICTLVSETFYDGALRPGTAAVAGQRLVETYERLGIAPPGDPIAEGPAVVLIDTSDDPEARDRVAGFAAEEARDNPGEARLVASVVAGLGAGAPAERRRALAAEIGVISPYRRQNNLIRRALHERDPVLAGAVRVDTVDRFQGGERDVIVVSLTNANAAAAIGPLHRDWRRMNVALSRARRLLVIVGNRRTFTQPGRPEEEPAKAVYRRLFATLDRLAATGEAAIVPAARLGDGA